MIRPCRADLFERWLETAAVGQGFVYHRGELSRDRQRDPVLSRLADRVLGLSNGRFDVVSTCGHIRGRIIGTGAVRMVTMRDQGETVYLAIKR